MALVGLLILALGVANLVWPYEIARFAEQLDGIGSKRSWDEIEPADWKVAMYRGFGMVGVVAGLGIVLGG